jgi:hypothetical protein
MNNKNKKTAVVYSLFKWGIIVLSYAYLVYKILSFDNFDQFKEDFANITFVNFQWLFLVLLLLPLNWLTEAYKWQYLCLELELISTKTAVKSVLAGLIPGFLSPNRIGEIIGRPMLLKPENRISGGIMTAISGFSQTITIIACGIPPAVFFFFYHSQAFGNEYKYYTYFCIFWLAVFLLIYSALPRIAKKFAGKNLFKKLKKELLTISKMPVKKLFYLLGFCFVRYFIFCLQFYFLLFFCNVYVTPFEAFIGISLNYLFITITPSMSFSEVVIRASYAVFFIGFFSENTIGIATAGILLWIINFILPMIAGSFFFAKTKVS